ncbi:MAG: flagellar hook-basal body complex protein [Rhodospirillales bacterium]|nr:flagellar hook-basal body complex protein [Rhodospirillales bacterium]
MSMYGMFSTPTLAMMSQSHAMNTIGLNIANVNTGGYKSTDTRFTTVLANTMDKQSDIGGVRPLDYFRIDQQGLVTSSASHLDVSINGQGFFVLNTQQDGSGETLYSRDGNFLMTTGETVSVTADDNSTIQVEAGYLIDKNGYYVQGVAANADGTFTIPGTPQSLRVDQYAFTSIGQATTAMNLSLNLPATGSAGDQHLYSINVIDSNNIQRAADITFTKGTTPNTWSFTTTTDAGTSAAQTLTFDSNGALTGTSSYTLPLTWADAATASITADYSAMTQFAGDFIINQFTRDGYAANDMQSFTFDNSGHITGTFEDLTQRKIYKLPLAIFSNPNGLEPRNGNTYALTGESGPASLVSAASDGYAQFSPFSREMSNVDLADEFTKMIMTQNAYNSSATVFRTLDEMVQSARDLKR